MRGADPKNLDGKGVYRVSSVLGNPLRRVFLNKYLDSVASYDAKIMRVSILNNWPFRPRTSMIERKGFYVGASMPKYQKRLAVAFQMNQEVQCREMAINEL